MIPKNSAFLFVIEGLLIYFEEDDVRTLFRNISDWFPMAEILFDAMSPMHLAANVPGIDKELTPFLWGVASIEELEQWDSRIRCEEQWFFQDSILGGRNILADMFGSMLRPDSKVGRIAIRRNADLE